MKSLIKLFASNESNFKHCKWILNETIKAIITEDIEGHFELDLEYPLFDKKGLSKYIIRGNIISCPVSDDRPNQLFKIRKVTKDTNNNVINVYAEAIARADADNNYIPGLEVPAGKTRKEALQIVLNNRADKRRFYTIGSLDTSTNKNVNLGLDDDTGNVINYVDIADKSLLSAILEESTDKTNSSIYAAYKGEIIWNNFEINMVDERGKDHSFVIKSGKNLESLEEEIDDTGDDFATALVMKSSDGLFLPNQEIIYSPNANKYDRYFFKTIQCEDVSFEDLVTENSTDADIENAKQIVYEQLRERAQKQFDNGIDKPPTNYTVNFIMLKDSEEYKDYAPLEKCELGNNVTTIYSKIGIKADGRVISIKYNALTDKIEEVEIGDRLKKDIISTINNTTNTATTAKSTAIEANTNAKKAGKAVKGVQVGIDELSDSLKLYVLIDKFGSMIDMNYKYILLAVNDERNGTDVIITKDGLSVYKGKFRIYDEDGEEVFGINQSGRVRVFSEINVEQSSGTAVYDTFGMELETKDGDRASITIDKSNGKLNIRADGGVYINGERVGGD